MVYVKYSIETTTEFNEWFEDQKDKVKGLIKMAKTKTLKKQKKSSPKAKEPQYLKLKAGVKTHSWNPTNELLDEDNLRASLFDALKQGDTEAFKEILTGHLEAKIKSKSAQAHGLSARTMYEALSEKGNPSLKTIAKIVQMACAA
jgi:probable addiction module antidote protein